MAAHEQEREVKRKICDPIRNLHDSPFDNNNTVLEAQENDFFPAMKKTKGNRERGQNSV